eukprot:jgi/Galph1/1518/GphlegSOOS_G210.1
MNATLAKERATNYVKDHYFPIFQSALIFLDHKAGELLSTFLSLEELLSSPVLAEGVHLLLPADRYPSEQDSHSLKQDSGGCKVVVLTCEERPGTTRLLQRIRNSIPAVDSLIVLTNWTEEDCQSYENVLLDAEFGLENLELDRENTLGILGGTSSSPFGRTVEALQFHYSTDRIQLLYAAFLGCAFPLDNLFITVSKEEDRKKLLWNEEINAVEGLAELSEPLRSILATVARCVAAFCNCLQFRSVSTYTCGSFSKLIVEQFHRCFNRSAEEWRRFHQEIPRKQDGKDACLLIIDRMAILSSAFETGENLLDRVFTFFPRRCLDATPIPSKSYATELWKLVYHMMEKKQNLSIPLNEDEWKQLLQVVLFGEAGQGLLADCQVNKEDGILGQRLLSSSLSVCTAEQTLDMVRELLIHILEDQDNMDSGNDSWDMNPTDYSFMTVEELLDDMKKTTLGKPLSTIYGVVFQIGVIALEVFQKSEGAIIWNMINQVMKDIETTENENNWSQDSSSNLLLNLLDGIQKIVTNPSLSEGFHVQNFQVVLLLICWIYVSPQFRELESTEEDILLDTLMSMMDKECYLFLETMSKEEWTETSLQKLLLRYGVSRMTMLSNVPKESITCDITEEDDTYLERGKSITKDIFHSFRYLGSLCRTYWRQPTSVEKSPCSVIRRMLSQFKDFRKPSTIHVIGKLKELREDDGFGLHLDYVPPEFLSERIFSGLQRLYPFGTNEGNQKKTLILFVVGGLCFSELSYCENFVKEFFREEFDEILFGSTHIVSALEMLYLVSNFGLH